VNKVFIAVIIISLVGIAAFWIYSWQNNASGETHETESPHTSEVRQKALKADGLSTGFPDPKALQEWKEILEEAGYEVIVLEGDQVNLTLYEHLTQYDLIILRVHGGIGKITTPLYTVKFNALFTGVEWSNEYESLRNEGLIARGHPFFINKTYVAVKKEFFAEKLVGRFSNNSIMIVAGCFGLYTEDIWRVLSSRGLQMYIGWKGEVTPTHMDQAVTFLIRHVFQEKIEWGDAVYLTNKNIGPDTLSGETMDFRKHR